MIAVDYTTKFFDIHSLTNISHWYYASEQDSKIWHSTDCHKVLKYSRSDSGEIHKDIKIRLNRRLLLKTTDEFFINPDVGYKNIIPLEDILALYSQHLETPADRHLEVQQPHRTTRSGRQDSIPDDTDDGFANFFKRTDEFFLCYFALLSFFSSL